MSVLRIQTNWLQLVSRTAVIFTGIALTSIAWADDVLPPVVVDPWCTSPGGTFEMPIKLALEAEKEVFNPDNLAAALPLPIPEPAYAQMSHIARLFSQISVEVIEARSSMLKEIFDPLPDPDPPNLENRVRNNLKHALLFVDLLEASINRAEARAVLSDEGAETLRRYAGNVRDLIEVIPITIP